MEHKEALKTSAVVGKLSDPVEAEVDNFLSDGVVSSGEVVGGILLSGDELLGVEELSVGSGSDLIDDGGFEIEEDAPGDVLSGSGFGEEGVEGIITATDSFVGGHLTVRLDAVFEAEEFPAGIADLDTSLTNVDGDNFSHLCFSEIFITYFDSNPICAPSPFESPPLPFLYHLTSHTKTHQNHSKKMTLQLSPSYPPIMPIFLFQLPLSFDHPCRLIQIQKNFGLTWKSIQQKGLGRLWEGRRGERGEKGVERRGERVVLI